MTINIQPDHCSIISALKIHNYFIFTSVRDNIVDLIKEHINLENVLVCYQIEGLFKVPKLLNFIDPYIMCHFTKYYKTKIFLELDFCSVYKTLSESKLNVTSELKVFKAANAWFSFKSKERNKLAKNLFLKVRYPLFSIPA